MITNLGPLVVLALSTTVLAGDINRQSIIFNEKTPDVFYCPQVRLILGPTSPLTQDFSIGEADLHRQNAGQV